MLPERLVKSTDATPSTLHSGTITEALVSGGEASWSRKWAKGVEGNGGTVRGKNEEKEKGSRCKRGEAVEKQK